MEVFYFNARLNGQMVTRLEKTVSKENMILWKFHIKYLIFFSLV